MVCHLLDLLIRWPPLIPPPNHSDYNFALDANGNGAECIPVGPEPIPTGSCLREDDSFKGSSGYRLVPGNSCDVKSGIHKDDKISKPCRAGTETPGLVTHQLVSSSSFCAREDKVDVSCDSQFNFPGVVLDHTYFGESHVRSNSFSITNPAFRLTCDPFE